MPVVIPANLLKYLVSNKIPHAGTTQYIFRFPNNYGASVISGPYSYGGTRGLWELAVLIFPQGEITYDTPITNDVLGYQTFPDIIETLYEIKDLKPV